MHIKLKSNEFKTHKTEHKILEIYIIALCIFFKLSLGHWTNIGEFI